MITNTATHPTTGTLSTTSTEYDIILRSILLLAIHCQLHVIRQFIQQLDTDPDNTDPAFTRVLARLLTGLGQALDDIEACAAHDAWEVDSDEEEHVSLVMSFYYDVREEFDDFLV